MIKTGVKEFKITMAVLLLMTVIIVIGCKKQENNDVRVTTYTPQDITQTSAVCGGDVIVTQGLTLNSLGVCWSTERNPMVENAHLSTNNWSEPYVCTITGLAPGTKYHVRAYALRGLEYYYGDDKSFTTEGNSGGGGGGSLNGHAYVDLGLPSGLLWATCNVGADSPEEYGDYFAWGETQPKEYYDWSTYQYANGTSWQDLQLTKYCTNADYGYNGFTDNLTTLLPEDDAATANWGSGWRMPTKEEWQELYNNTTHTWTTQNGMNGRLFTAMNGNSLFLPAAGYRYENDFYNSFRLGYYWSSSLDTGYPDSARYFYFDSGNYGMGYYGYRYDGVTVRPVCSSRQN